MLNHILAGLGAALMMVAAAAGCSASSSPTSQVSAGILVFRTADSMMMVTGLDETELRVRVKVLGAAACVDDDHDHDGVPDSMDDHDTTADELEAEGMDRHEHSGDAGDGEGVREDHSHDCQACNRGPGVSGELRFEAEGPTGAIAGKLDRGKVFDATADSLTIAAPPSLGTLTITITATTEIDDGVPAPGAEIRAEGTAVQTATGWVLTATKIDVLCDAAAVVPPAIIPPDAVVIPAIQ